MNRSLNRILFLTVVGCGGSTVATSTDSGTVADAGDQAGLGAPTKAQTAVPMFSVPGGEYCETQAVSVTSATPNASVYYTLDGNVPSSASTKYLGPIAIATTTTLRAIAIAPGYDPSPVNSATYTLVMGCVKQAATPTFSPNGGSFISAQIVTIASTTPNARIYFTTNGILPTATSGTLYGGPIAIANTTTLIAVASATGMLDSNPALAKYVITCCGMMVAAPTLAPGSGQYTSPQAVLMSASTADATICYTVDGNTPTCDPTKPLIDQCTGTSIRYLVTSPPVVNTATAVKAIACRAGWTNSSQTSATYTF